MQPIAIPQIWRRGETLPPRRAASLLLALVGALLVVELAQVTLGVPGAASGPLSDAMVVAILTLPVLAFLLAASAQQGKRLGWFLIGAGLTFNSLGEAYFFFAQTSLVDFPTVGDFLCLAMFPPLIAGVVMLVRSGRAWTELSIGLDGVVIALAVGALAYELIFNAVLGAATTSRLLVEGQLAYPILDLAVLVMVAVICSQSHFRVGAAYFWLATGMAVLLATDVINLHQATTGDAYPSTALYFGWAAAIVLLALSARFSAELTRSEALSGRRLQFALGGAMLLALGLLLEEASRDQNLVVLGASATALVLGLVRLFRTLTENSHLIRERDAVISSQREMEQRLRFQADHDPLTGLANRRRFAQRLDEQIRYARRYRHTGALLLLDLDSFKFINDSFGHPAGDRVLRRVAGAISGSLRATDVAARLGGDEFAVLLPEVDEAAALKVAEAVLGAIKAGHDPTVEASLGLVRFGDGGGRTAEDLLVAADIALYEAKQSGGHGCIRVFRGQEGQRLAWVDRIRVALREDRLVLSAQPIVDLDSGRVEREELLVRMLDRDGGEIAPGEFLPTAERFGLIADIDRLVVAKAIELAKSGRAVAVNISGPSMTDRELLDRVASAVHGGLDPHLLSFELTETTGVANLNAARRFAVRLEALGCELALDDFGSGLSWLGHLKHIPIQTLKIDNEFIRGVGQGSFDRYLVRTIVDLAGRLGQKTVAEGVEDETTLAIVRDLGVDYAQGYYLGRPKPVDAGRRARAATEGAPAQHVVPAASSAG